MRLLVVGLLSAVCLLSVLCLRPWPGEPLLRGAIAAVPADDEIPHEKLVAFRQSCSASAATNMGQSRANAYCRCFVEQMRLDYSHSQFDDFERRVIQAASASADGTAVSKVFLDDNTLRGIMFSCLEQTQ